MEAVWKFLQDEWPKLVWGAVPIVAALLGVWRVRRAWRRRDTMNRLCVTLNRVVDGKLSFRTLLEVPLKEALLNSHGEKLVLKAAARCKPGQPFLELKNDAWYAHNALLNVISERFAEGFVHEALGLPVVKQNFLIALTNEIDGPVRTHKIRAQVIGEELLAKFAKNDFREKLQLEKSHHSVRVSTLRKMHDVWQGVSGANGYVLPIEIAVPAAAKH